MRLSLVTASLAISVALLAACSTSPQGTSGVPGSSQQAATTKQYAALRPPAHLTRDQAAHLRVTVLPRGVLEHARPAHVPQIDRKGVPAAWLTDAAGYIWGLRNTLLHGPPGTKIVTYLTDCSGAEGGIVDHAGRLVVACTDSGTVNIYKKGNYTGPADVVLSLGDSADSFYFPAAAFEDANGNIYATNLYYYYDCEPSCIFGDGNIVWWTTSNQTSGALPSGTYTDPNMAEDYFADVDSSGNVYLDGFNQSFLPELDEISSIMEPSASATDLGLTLNYPGGIYVTGSNELSVIDQGCYGCGNASVTLYSLPYSGAVVTGPLVPPQNASNTCDPVAGGYNKGEQKLLIGDAGCHVGDLARVPSAYWKLIVNNNFVTPIAGAFVSSDKK
jgi:hypothetical protein